MNSNPERSRKPKQSRFHFKKHLSDSDSDSDIELGQESKVVFDLKDRDDFLKSQQQQKHEKRIVSEAIKELAQRKRDQREKQEQRQMEQELLEESGVLERMEKRRQVREMQADVEASKEQFSLADEAGQQGLSHVEVNVQPISFNDDAYYQSSSEEDEETLEEKLERQQQEDARRHAEKEDRRKRLPDHLKNIYGVHKLDLNPAKLTELVRDAKKKKRQRMDNEVKSKKATVRQRSKASLRHMKNKRNRLKKRNKDGDEPAKKRRKTKR